MRWRHGPPAPVEVRREGGRTTAVIHASVDALVKAALIGWLGLWALGEVTALRLAAAGAESALPFLTGFTRFFLVGWTLVGALAGHALLWCYQGTVELSTDGAEFVYRRQVRGLGRTRRFALDRVKHVWIRYDAGIRSLAQVADDTPVRIGFDVGGRTYPVGLSLRHVDAQRVVAAIKPGPAPGPQPAAPRRPAALAGPPPLPPR